MIKQDTYMNIRMRLVIKSVHADLEIILAVINNIVCLLFCFFVTIHVQDGFLFVFVLFKYIF